MEFNRRIDVTIKKAKTGAKASKPALKEAPVAPKPKEPTVKAQERNCRR